MIFALIAVYALAGVTIGRMTYEFDVWAVESSTVDEAIDARRSETRAAVLTGILWPIVPVFALVVHVRTPR